MLEGEDDGPIQEDAGWSDDEIDFDDGGDDGGQGEERCFAEAELEIAKEGTTSPPAKAMHEERRGPFFKEKYVDDEAALDTPSHQPPIPRPPTLHANALPVMTKPPLPPPPPPLPPSQRQQPNPKHRRSLTFEEEFVIVLREKNDAELKGMEESGRMKRWTPMSEDPVLRQRLMEVMVAQLQG
jgi:hypothetical protein